jgi:hypothetical protein
MLRGAETVRGASRMHAMRASQVTEAAASYESCADSRPFA